MESSTAALTDSQEPEETFPYDTMGEPAEPVPQVSSLIAVIRIISVLGMGLCISFGLFIMLVGLEGVLIGIPIILLAIPCYYGMQFAEKLANRAAATPTD
ncbi:MAG: hypothetical protein WD359_04095 [Dehalococcoidia bacterium]